MWKLWRVLWSVALATGCSSPKRVCNASIDRRANGEYERLNPKQIEAVNSEYAYACASACYDFYNEDGWDQRPAGAIKKEPICVESSLLGAMSAPETAHEELDEICKYGVTSACTWLTTHEGQIVAAKLAQLEADKVATAERDKRGAAEAAAEAARPKMTASEAAAAVASGASSAIAAGQQNNWVVIFDREIDIAAGGGSIDSSLISGDAYMAYVIGGETTQYRAAWQGRAADTEWATVEGAAIDFGSRTSVRTLTVDLRGAPPLYEQHISISDVVGDRHPLRVLVMKQP